jgi:hypothetical protein
VHTALRRAAHPARRRAVSRTQPDESREPKFAIHASRTAAAQTSGSATSDGRATRPRTCRRSDRAIETRSGCSIPQRVGETWISDGGAERVAETASGSSVERACEPGE